MSPRTEKQFKEIRETKKALIVNAAMELFANEGYHPASISKIAKKAGISKGLIYNYFESKEDLLLQIMTAGLDEMASAFDPNNDGVLSEEEMASFIYGIFTMLKEKHEYWKLYYAVFFQPKVSELLESKFVELYTKMMKILTDYYQSHGVKKPEQEALLFGALIDGMAFNYILNPKLFPIESLIETVKDKFCYIKK
ncbi:MAG: TetR/AcrR family transcriptional regulator [Bacteroidetes bacterium]|nr:TetR/AcrR family transcriptional regulator [Bacteroidota bacterium]